MPRPLRRLANSSVVHVWSRGADRQDIFLDDQDRHAFVDSLAAVPEHHDIAIHAYALMSNHHHLILESLDGTAAPISAAMHRVGLETARRHNARYQRTGPLFENRFGLKEITNDRQLSIVGRYVHRNPIVLPTPLSEYPYSSLGAYTGRVRSPDWLTTERLRGAPGGSLDTYEEFVCRRLPGDADDSTAAWPWGRIELDVLDETIGAAWPTSSEAERRALAVTLALGHRVANAADLADRYRLTSAAAARSIARRTRSRRSVDAAVDARASSIEQHLGWAPMNSDRHRAA